MRLFKFMKAIFYPKVNCISIFFQFLFSFILIGILFLFESYTYENANKKYDYLSDNVIHLSYEENTEIVLKKMEFLLEKKIENIDYVKCTDIKIGESKDIYRMFFSNNIEDNISSSIHRKCKFTILGDGDIFVSKELYSLIVANQSYYFADDFEETNYPIPKIKGVYEYVGKESSMAVNTNIYATSEYYEKIKGYIREEYVDSIVVTFDEKLDWNDAINFEKNKLNNVSFKSYKLYIELTTYTNIFSIVKIFILVMVVVSFFSIGWMIFEKSLRLSDDYYINKIFYKNTARICISRMINNVIILILSFILSLIFLSFVQMVIIILNDFIVHLNYMYYILFGLYVLVTLFTSLLSTLFSSIKR